MEATLEGVTLVVDTSEARWPVEIDPTLHGDWSAVGPSGTNGFGEELAAGHDINGDGFTDVVVGVYAGTIYLYEGSATGPSTTPDQTLTATTSYDKEFVMEMVEDVNGDGYDELVVGDWHYTGGHTYEGRVLLFAGSASGLPTSGTTIVEGNQTNAYLGYSVAGAGDVNGDGYNDLVVGAYGYDHGSTDEGEAWVFLGSATGLATTATWSYDGDQSTAYFGVRVMGVGDLNGDGFDDIAASATYYDNGQTNEGQVFVFHGSATGPATEASWTYDSDISSGYLGSGFARDYDANGDGYADLAVGWSSYTSGHTNEGGAIVFHGSASGLGATPSWQWQSNYTNARAGGDIANAGDADGDGDDELILGGSGYATGGGAVWIFEGGASGLGATPDVEMLNELYSTYLGDSVEGAGDLDGDGYDDVVYCAMQFDGG
ncbi:MAG: VCBS repeat-containing protein, partial [Myxococcota bacterium]